MNKRFQRRVLFCLVTVWALLLSVCFIENLGYLCDTEEYDSQGIEQILSLPVDITVINLSEFFAVLLCTGFIFITLPFFLKSAQLTRHTKLFFERYGPESLSKIFKLASAYRI